MARLLHIRSFSAYWGEQQYNDNPTMFFLVFFWTILESIAVPEQNIPSCNTMHTLLFRTMGKTSQNDGRALFPLPQHPFPRVASPTRFSQLYFFLFLSLSLFLSLAFSQECVGRQGIMIPQAVRACDWAVRVLAAHPFTVETNLFQSPHPCCAHTPPMGGTGWHCGKRSIHGTILRRWTGTGRVSTPGDRHNAAVYLVS